MVKVVLLSDPDVSDDTETSVFYVDLDGDDIRQIPWDYVEWTLKETEADLK